MRYAILAFLLSGCAGFDADGNPNPIWIGENVCIGSGCPGYVRPPHIAAAMLCDRDGNACRELLPAAYLYRDDPDEKPVTIRVEVGEGRFVNVAIYDRKCRVSDSMNASYMDLPAPAVYLCGNRRALTHELDHARGMRHTEWQNTGVANCATVIEAGYKTRYLEGQRICVAPNGYEFVDK